MLLLTCPHCGVSAEETEFAPGGAAHLRRAGPGSSDAEFEEYMFLRDNLRGVHFERWRHAYGCGKWFLAARCTATLEIFGTYPAQTVRPPADILAAIRKRRPGWHAAPDPAPRPVLAADDIGAPPRPATVPDKGGRA